MKYIGWIFILLLSCTSGRKLSQDTETLVLNVPGQGQVLEIEFQQGSAYNHPSFVIWLEDLDGTYRETLFITQYVATGKYGHGQLSSGRWDDQPGEARRPATLPYWAHKRGIQAPDGLYIPSPEAPMPDAVTRATPKGDFRLETQTGEKQTKKFRVLMEINQAWDSNRYWTNTKFPGDGDYFTSLQPAIVYAVTVNPDEPDEEYYLNPIGHSHPSGKNGKLYTDLSTLTTAKEIAGKICVRIKQP
jgi:hypothetical protein